MNKVQVNTNNFFSTLRERVAQPSYIYTRCLSLPLRLPFFLLLILTAGLASCFDYNQFVEIEEDGQAKYTAELVFPDLVVEMLEIEGAPFACRDRFDPVEKEGIVFEYEDFERAGHRVCRCSAVGALTDMDGLQFNRSLEDEAPTVLFVTDLGGGRYRLVSDFGAIIDDAYDDEVTGAAAFMASALLRGHVVRFEVTAPEILNSNGELVAESTKARWNRPLSKIVVRDAQDPAAFVAEIQLPQTFTDRISSWWHRVFGSRKATE